MEKKVYELTINPELQNIFPPLSSEAINKLMANLEKDGCTDPLIVWNGTIVDGHNRYHICREKNIPFAIHEMSFSCIDDAIDWMILRQLGRRNLTDYQRGELTLKHKQYVQDAAKKRMLSGKKIDPPPTLAEGAEKGDTRDKLAEMAQVSHGTLSKIEKLDAEADEETKEKLRKNEISINRAYNDLKRKKIEGTSSTKESLKTSEPQAVVMDGKVLPGMLKTKDGIVHVGNPFPDDLEGFSFVLDLARRASDSYIALMTNAVSRYTSGMESSENDEALDQLIRATYSEVKKILKNHKEKKDE